MPRIVTPLNQVALNNKGITQVNAAQTAQLRTHVQQQFNAQSQQRIRSEANAGTVLRTPRVTSAPRESFYSGNAGRGNGNGATQFGTLNNAMPFRERPAGNAGAGSLPRSFPGPVIRNAAPANAAAPNAAPRNFPGPVIRNGAPGNAGMPGAAPRSFQAPVIRNAAPAYTGSSHAMPPFSRPAPSFHGGGAPSMHGGGGGHGAASFQGGGGGHGGGGHGAAPAGGGHNNGKH